MNRTTLAICALIALIACGQTAKTERHGQPDIYSVEGSDKEMNEAINKSRDSFGQFVTAFENKNGDQTGFSVKMPFLTEDGAEHIWVVRIYSVDGKLFGQVDNVPENVSGVELGDEIEIERNKISDWFYIENNRLIGGLTIRLLRDRMSPYEKEQFDQEFGVELD
jgi:uncharacterized protein YegJ (DUF2314 family)